MLPGQCCNAVGFSVAANLRIASTVEQLVGFGHPDAAGSIHVQSEGLAQSGKLIGLEAKGAGPKARDTDIDPAVRNEELTGAHEAKRHHDTAQHRREGFEQLIINRRPLHGLRRLMIRCRRFERKRHLSAPANP